MKVLICGGPKVGKTTLAKKMGGRVRHTDDLIGKLGWSEASEEVSRWMDEPGPWIIEGVAVPRAVRKWLERNPDGRPCDVAYWGDYPRVPYDKPGQAAMAKGCEKVWDEVCPKLADRGVTFKVFPA